MICIMQQKTNSIFRETQYMLHNTQYMYRTHADRARNGFFINEKNIEIKPVIPKKKRLLYEDPCFGNEKK